MFAGCAILDGGVGEPCLHAKPLRIGDETEGGARAAIAERAAHDGPKLQGLAAGD
jgi:hypothetical protein